MNRRTWAVAVLTTAFILLGISAALILGRSTDIIEVTQDNFQEQVLKSPTPVYIEVYATDCSPCAKQMAIVEKVVKDYVGKVRFVRINASSNPDLAQALKLEVVPTQFLYQPSNQSAIKAEGLLSEASLRKFIEQGLAAPKPTEPDTTTPQTPAVAPQAPTPAPQVPTMPPLHEPPQPATRP